MPKHTGNQCNYVMKIEGSHKLTTLCSNEASAYLDHPLSANPIPLCSQHTPERCDDCDGHIVKDSCYCD